MERVIIGIQATKIKAMYRHFFKRLLDILFSLCALIVSSPVLFVLAICLLAVNKGSGVFFIQTRPGKDGKLFRLVKFKTMTDQRDVQGNLLPDVQRLTPAGRWIRSTSLDELPQLLNVLKGDMSLIGPRPLLPQYLRLYSERQARRHEVRPGISGWAQVNGRNAIPWSQKLEYDVWYVDHISFRLDLLIVIRTFTKVFFREGINAENSSSINPFTGND
jgi:lipopolysaccharide/colanic/teichoic acid biosynthesis glycosyltransferase